MLCIYVRPITEYRNNLLLAPLICSDTVQYPPPPPPPPPPKKMMAGIKFPHYIIGRLNVSDLGGKFKGKF